MWDWFQPVLSETLSSVGNWLGDAAKAAGEGISQMAENIEMPGGGGLKTSSVGSLSEAGPATAAVPEASSSYVNNVMDTLGQPAQNADWTASSGAGVPVQEPGVMDWIGGKAGAAADWIGDAAKTGGKFVKENPDAAATMASAGAGAAKSLMDYWQYREERDERERRYNPAQASSGGSNYGSHYRNLSANSGGGGGLLY